MNIQKLYIEIDNLLLNDAKPSIKLRNIFSTDKYDSFPISLIYRLKDTPQSKLHHPEGDVFEHTMLVVDKAAKCKTKSNYQRAFMWAALLHDIGKADTTKIRKGRITSYDHDKIGAKCAFEFLSFFNEDSLFVDRVTALVRWHMQSLYVSKGLPFANIEQMSTEIDIEDVALLSLCDRLGRGKLTSDKRLEEEESIRQFTDYVFNYLNEHNLKK